MIKNENSKNLVQSMFGITKYHKGLIDMLIKNKGFTSGSDVVRRAIEELYEHYYPPYRQPSPAGKFKQKKLEEQETFENMSPSDYARSLKLTVLPTTDGREIALIRIIGAPARLDPYPVERIKELGEDSQLIQEHYIASDRATTEEVLENYCNEGEGGVLFRKRLYNSYPIIFPGYEHEHSSKPSDEPNTGASV